MGTLPSGTTQATLSVITDENAVLPLFRRRREPATRQMTGTFAAITFTIAGEDNSFDDNDRPGRRELV